MSHLRLIIVAGLDEPLEVWMSHLRLIIVAGLDEPLEVNHSGRMCY